MGAYDWHGKKLTDEEINRMKSEVEVDYDYATFMPGLDCPYCGWKDYFYEFGDDMNCPICKSGGAT